ncbi:CDP-alcohol phosphatidyltransferase [Thiohalorhabdus denitrificans]|uniref:CDP-alcohol phosphatidyltransferase n=1 Tax=Thiohalorhabdus denitrificans TaxID=381306 RepID=A0A1G5EWE4_9GAMM|nr:CDP-alcohol phosphatidyltransferase [Thiohalorhabdus denitrificans]
MPRDAGRAPGNCLGKADLLPSGLGSRPGRPPLPRPAPVERLRGKGKAGLERLLGPLVRALVRSPVPPNQVTAVSLLLTLAAAGVLAAGHLPAAGALFLLGSALDLLDGTLARASGRATPFGAFLDPTLDRVGEGALPVALWTTGQRIAHVRQQLSGGAP